MVTALLRARWLVARVVGVDNSPAMIDRERVALPVATWELDDLTARTPPVAVDFMVSNTALQWLDDPAALFPRKVHDGGV
jgi:trans-aconitate 2-methyltransferase